MPSYDFSLPDNQPHLDRMKKELNELEQERSQMRRWKEKEWYEDRFQDAEQRGKYRKEHTEPEPILNPSGVDFTESPRLVFTMNTRLVRDYIDDVVHWRFRPYRRATYIATGASLVLVILGVLLGAGLLPIIILWLMAGLGYFVFFGLRWMQQRRYMVKVLQHANMLMFECSANQIFRTGDAAANVRMHLDEPFSVYEIDMGIVVAIGKEPLPSYVHHLDLQWILDDPDLFLIPECLHGYASVKAWLQKQE